jgi:hypothetical protein
MLERRDLRASVDPEARVRFGPGVAWLPETAPPTLPSEPGDPPALGTAQRRVLTDEIVAPATMETPSQVQAVLFRDELVGLSSGASGRFRPTRMPRLAVKVWATDDPPVPWDDATVLVRFRAEPLAATADAGSPEAALRPLDVGWLELPDRPRELLVVPESALLRSAEGPYVLVASTSSATLERRLLQIGRTYKGWVSVTSGLTEGERLVIGSAFFLDADAGAQSGAGLLAGVAR